MKMRAIIYTLAITAIYAAHLKGGDFQPTPSFVTSANQENGYMSFGSYQIVTPAEQAHPDFDPADTVSFANLMWRGAQPQFLKERIRNQTIYGKAISSAVLLVNADKWIELGVAPYEDINGVYENAYLLYEWNAELGGTRKASFFLKGCHGAPKWGEVMEIGNGLALVKLGMGLHDWIRVLILDLSTFTPKAIIDCSDLEILDFEIGIKLQVRYKSPVTRTQLLSDLGVVETLPWTTVDVVTGGVLNQDPINASQDQFVLSIPAAD